MRKIQRLQSAALAALLLSSGGLAACGDDNEDTPCIDVDDNGICDSEEECPDVNNNGICDEEEEECDDADNDGICDDEDNCVDVDEDGICDDEDSCIDADADGLCDDDPFDVCFGDDGSGDSDDDGICDDMDACDGDDSTGDSDEDGICDDIDLCTGDDLSGDTDNDGICDDEDDCQDIDNDDICDDEDDCIDVDNDGLCDDDPNDVCVGDDNTGDSDADGICDDLDMCTGDDNTGDSDADGICDDLDACIGDDGAGDADEDGYCADVDCNDNVPHINPGAPEYCGDGADSDCNPDTTEDGRVAVSNTAGEWFDVTDTFATGTVETYTPEVDNESLHFCGGEFHGRVVSGYSISIYGESGTNVLSAEGENVPVIEVNPAIVSATQANVAIFDMELRHSEAAAGNSNAIGVSVYNSFLTLNNVDIVNNEGLAAGGLFASDSNISLGGEVDFRENYGFSGAAMTLRSSGLNTRSGTYGFYNNLSADGEAAIDLTGSEFFISGPANPIVYFAGNTDDDGAGNIADLLMDNESTVTIGTAYFQPQDSCTEDNVTVIGVAGYCYEGASAVTAFNCNVTGCTPTP